VLHNGSIDGTMIAYFCQEYDEEEEVG